MANEQPTQPSTPPTIPHHQEEYIADHDDGEIIVAFFRRHGPWIVFVVVATAIFLGYGTYRDSKEKSLRHASTMYLEEILDDFNSNPVEKRMLIEKALNDSLVQQSPQKDWLEFLLVRTHIEEAQRNLVKDSTLSPHQALEKVNEYIKTHQHSQLIPFAFLSKAVLLEEMGKLEESQAVIAELNQYPSSEAFHISQRIMDSTSQQERYTLWQNYLKQNKP